MDEILAKVSASELVSILMWLGLEFSVKHENDYSYIKIPSNSELRNTIVDFDIVSNVIDDVDFELIED